MEREIREKQIELLERKCRERGVPLTVQRRTVFEAVVDHDGHPTADLIYDLLADRLPGLSRTTVYRVLDTFVQMKLVKRICHHSSAARYDALTDRHHHLVCSQCDTIIDIGDDSTKELAMPDVSGTGFEIDDYFIHFHGVCAACRAKPSA